jgi:colicin import membrane protein
MSFIRQHKGAVMWSLALHVAVVAAVLVGIPFPERPRVPVATALIQGTIVDTAAIEREQKAREEAARLERQKQQREERQRREADEQRRQTQQREEQRVAAEQRAREVAEQKERDRVAAAKAEQQRRDREAQEKREKDAQAQREREAAEKRAAEQRAADKRRESELQQQLALEAEANAARAAGLYDQYVRAIENRIKSKWQRPLSARAGIDCVVTIVQLPTGDVVGAPKVESCNGDDAVRRSIERAVLDASPLPKAPTPALFERVVKVRFQPEE